MIIRVLDEEKAKICDNLLTKLIQDEKKYDENINEDLIIKDYFKNVIKNKDNILLCYYDNNSIKGYIYLKSIRNNNKKGYLVDGLYVEEKYRNKNIGSKLIDEALKIVNSSDANYIDINVLFDNKIAYKIYKSFGFDEFKVSLRKRIK